MRSSMEPKTICLGAARSSRMFFDQRSWTTSAWGNSASKPRLFTCKKTKREKKRESNQEASVVSAADTHLCLLHIIHSSDHLPLEGDKRPKARTFDFIVANRLSSLKKVHELGVSERARGVQSGTCPAHFVHLDHSDHGINCRAARRVSLPPNRVPLLVSSGEEVRNHLFVIEKGRAATTGRPGVGGGVL